MTPEVGQVVIVRRPARVQAGLFTGSSWENPAEVPVWFGGTSPVVPVPLGDVVAHGWSHERSWA
jgi:hypothetical protein